MVHSLCEFLYLVMMKSFDSDLCCWAGLIRTLRCSGYSRFCRISNLASILWKEFVNVRRDRPRPIVITEFVLHIDQDIDQENQGAQSPPAIWPTREGSIEVKDLVVSYAPQLPPVLSGVSFKVMPKVSESSPPSIILKLTTAALLL